jgi:hypothetical protein
MRREPEFEAERIGIFAIATVLRETRTFDGSHYSYIEHLADDATREKIRTLFLVISPASIEEPTKKKRMCEAFLRYEEPRYVDYVLHRCHSYYGHVMSLQPSPRKWVECAVLLGYGSA